MPTEDPQPEFTIRHRIRRPVDEVFAAVTSGPVVCQYFTVTAESLELDAAALWTWSNGSAVTLHIDAFVRDEEIRLHWEASGVTYDTQVHLAFEPADETETLVTISESGWRADAAGFASSYEHCEGWTDFLLRLKVWLEHGIDLRR